MGTKSKNNKGENFISETEKKERKKEHFVVCFAVLC